MNIAEIEYRVDYFREGVTDTYEPVLVKTADKVTDWTGQDTIEACQPPF